jgi:hypothetical protein
MYVRLAFAVAIHVAPDILLVDEVLSVGDLQFQRKCQAAMRKKLGETTVVFVSHNLAAVNEVCQRAIWLDQGTIHREGSANDVIEAYVSASSHVGAPSSDSSRLGRRWGTGEATIDRVSLLDDQGNEISRVRPGSSICIEICYEAKRLVEDPIFGIGIYDTSGLALFGENTGVGGKRIQLIQGKGRVLFFVDSLPFVPGSYWLTVAIHRATSSLAYDWHDKAYVLNVGGPLDPSKVGMLSLSTSWRHLPAQ